MVPCVELDGYLLLNMRCQITKSEKPTIPDTNLDRIGKTGRYLQLRNFAFAPHKIYLGAFRLRPFSLVAVPKL